MSSKYSRIFKKNLLSSLARSKFWLIPLVDDHQSAYITKLKPEVCQIVALPFTLKSILRKKKNYGNSNISSCKMIPIFKKSSKRNQNPSRYYDSITNLKFQHKPKYHLSKILIWK
jgi:hypothetical protein